MAESQETSDYPGSLDTWVTLTNKEDLVEGSDINKLKAAIEAVQTEIGTDPAGTATNLTTRLVRMMNGVGAFAQGTSFPVSPTPVEGQVFYRTDENTPYVYDGANWIPFVASSYEFFTSSGTFTAPGGITMVYVSMVGGGGGGAAGTSGGAGGGGGGGGGSVVNYPYAVTPAGTYTVTIGAGGAGGAQGTGNAGGNGVNTSFDSAIIAAGGTGGQSSGTGGAGGGGLDAVTTTAGGPSIKGGNGASTQGGAGGGTLFGKGGTGGTSPVNAAANSGGGGGGGAAGNYAGSNGGSGACLVSW